MSSTSTFRVDHIPDFKYRALRWAQLKGKPAALLDHNAYVGYPHHSHDGLLALGSRRQISCRAGEGCWNQLEAFIRPGDWHFGYLGYDLKNETEDLRSEKPDRLGFPDLCFLVPEYVIEWLDGGIRIKGAEPDRLFKEISKTAPSLNGVVDPSPHAFLPRMPKTDYLDRVRQVLYHIQQGDVYELNFCQEFFAEDIDLDPVSTFWQLNESARAPFSSYFQEGDRCLLSTSPERFLKRSGHKLISQPIKGTIGRGELLADDLILQRQLLESAKDRQENIMIVDLVRNDLGRACLPGSIQVEELAGLYSFRHVHQLISTISGTINPQTSSVEAIRFAFPMGSMTGAPKVRSMELIEALETSRRGLYSGAVGYISPEGDFDFNVVIRSLLYSANRKYASLSVGGAIVADSEPESEYEECQVKVAGMLRALGIHLPESGAVNLP